MQQPFATEISSQSRENDILAEHESLLHKTVLDTGLSLRQPEADERRGLPTRRRVIPLLLIVLVGAALAFVPVALKDAPLTGRSIAHGPSH